MIVEASPWDELLTAFVTNKRSLSSVAPDVLLQVAERLEIVSYKKNAPFFKYSFVKVKPYDLVTCFSWKLPRTVDIGIDAPVIPPRLGCTRNWTCKWFWYWLY